jgi:uncharacterized protein
MQQRYKLFNTLLQSLDDPRHLIVVGARQVGKTTLVKQLMADLKQKRQDVTYITLEDPTILAHLNQHPENLFDYINPINTDLVSVQKYVMIDEIQYLANPTNFLKLLYDKYAPQLKIVATGSSAFYIDLNFKDSLAGRKKIIEVFTLNFEEFLHFKGQDDLLNSYIRLKQNPRAKALNETLLRSYFTEYLRFGGYPAVVLAPTTEYKIELLAELANSYIKKDIIESSIKSDYKVYQLLTLLAHQAGSLLNHNELGNTLQIASTTVENYIYLLKKSYHIALLPPKFGNIRKELTKMPKIYFNDIGLRNHFCRNFDIIDMRMDKGEILENYAYIRLGQLNGQDNLRYWRTTDGNEVDFVIESLNISYEVKYNATSFKANKYRKFKEAYPEYLLHLLSYETSDNTQDIFRL